MKLIEKNLNGFGTIGIVAVVAILIVLAGGGYFVYQRIAKPVNTGGIACTEEAKLCPDGSSVGRTGPNCEFAKCSGEIDDLTWNTFRNDEYGFEFKYPKEWEFGVFDRLHPAGTSRSHKRDFYVTDHAMNRLLVSPLGSDLFMNVTAAEKKSFDIGGRTAEWQEFKDVDGVYGIKIDDLSHDQYPDFEIVVIPVNNKKYIDTADLSAFNQILSTFKFIE